MKDTFIFISGGIIGSVVTWLFIKNKYKNMADKEIESVVYTFDNRRKELEKKYNELKKERINEVNKININSKNVNTKEYNKTINKLGYEYNTVTENEFSDYLDSTEIETNTEFIKPYIISPFEFGETNNEEKTLTYCSDKVLLNEDDMPIDNPEDILGEALNEFCLDDDCLYVRDETNAIDYEILRSEKRHDQIMNEGNINE